MTSLLGEARPAYNFTYNEVLMAANPMTTNATQFPLPMNQYMSLLYV